VAAADQRTPYSGVPRALRRRQFLALAAGATAAMATACAPTPTKTTKPVAKPTPTRTSVPQPTPSPTRTPTSTPTPSTTRPPTTLPTVPATPTPTPSPSPTVTPSPPAADAPLPNLVGTDPVWHLARRTTFGPTPALIAEVRATGATAWLAEQLNPTAIDDSLSDSYLTRYPSLSMTAPQIRAAYAAYSWTPMMEVVQATLARALWSKRQLFEVLVEFWTNHFHVMVPGSAELWDVKTAQDRDAIRPHALGTFTDLLLANAKAPAMMRYLDTAANSAATPNENYGRELLELHTVGIDAAYTQADVVDSARLLTGFTIGDDGTFAYDPSRHYVGPVRVLGFASANGSGGAGLEVADAYLAYLASHPATAQHVARKLAVRFVSDDPPETLVTRLAQIYLSSGTAIVPVLTALFASDEFLISVGQKTRRPVDDMVGAMRTVGFVPAAGGAGSLTGLYWCLNTLGQLPMSWTTPQGYPDATGAWLSTAGTLARWDQHIFAVTGWTGDGHDTPPPSALLGGRTPSTNGDLVDTVALRLLGVRLLDPQRAALVTFLSDSGCPNVADSIAWRLDILAALVLNSPQWIER
jgi:uncharacterized protein (DUF1800 family)